MGKKIVFFFIIFIFMLYISTTDIYALGEIVDGVKDFQETAEKEKKPIDEKQLKDISDIIFNVFQIIGIVVAAIIILIVGIKFMTGTVETKATIKESLTPLIIGIVIIFGAFTIWKIIVDIMQEAT